MPKRKNTYANNEKLLMRMVRVGNVLDDGSVEVVVATENPVDRYDRSRDEVVREVLTMSGVEFRTSARQLPIVDSHDASTVANVLGSVRDIEVRGDELVGRAMFADDDQSQAAYRKLQAGHLTDFSITATPNQVQYIRRGESTRVGEQVIDGPAEIVERWRPLDASLVAVGADERSTVRTELRRSYDQLLNTEDKDMAVSRETLIGLGMPESISEAAEVQQWLQDNVNATEQVDDSAKADTTADEPATDETEPVAFVDDVPADAELAAVGDADEVGRAVASERSRVKEVQTLCKKFSIARADAESWCNEGITVNEARDRVLRTMQDRNKPAGTSVQVNGSEFDSTKEMVQRGLLQKCYAAGGIRRDDHDGGDLQKADLSRMAEVLLRSGGVQTDRLSKREICMVAMGHQPTIQRLNIQRDTQAYHTTGSFANLLLDAANKTLQAAYEEAPFTWDLWARQASSVADFKNINRIRFSEAPDLEMVPESQSYAEGAMSDSKESYSVEKFGKIFSVSWETIINDDLDALARVPAMQGNAARRTQNKKVYEVLTTNANMSDGNALFSAAHGNLDASGAAPSVAELNAAYVAMMTQTGLSGEIINVEPKYIIGPPSLRGTILQLLGSFSDPAAGGTAAGNSNSINIHQNALVPIIEPQLEANSTTAFYLASDPSRIDTVEIAFLQGEESPVLESEYDFHKDVYSYKIRQTFGVKAIDWRGMFKNPGA